MKTDGCHFEKSAYVTISYHKVGYFGKTTSKLVQEFSRYNETYTYTIKLYSFLS